MERTCENCGAPVQRRSTKGRWPSLCPTCQDNPRVLEDRRRRRHAADQEARRKAAESRVEALMRRLEGHDG